MDNPAYIQKGRRCGRDLAISTHPQGPDETGMSNGGYAAGTRPAACDSPASGRCCSPPTPPQRRSLAGQRHGDPDGAEADHTEPQPVTYASTRRGPTSSNERGRYRPQHTARLDNGGRLSGERVPICMLRNSRILSQPVVTGAVTTRSGSHRLRPRLRPRQRRLLPPGQRRRRRALPIPLRRFRGWPMTSAAPG